MSNDNRHPTVNGIIQAAIDVEKTQDTLHSGTHYTGAFMMAIGRRVELLAAGEPQGIDFTAVEGTHYSSGLTGTHSRQFKDQNGRLYTMTITPHFKEEKL